MPQTVGELVKELSEGRSQEVFSHYVELIKELIKCDYTQAHVDITKLGERYLFEPKGIWLKKGEVTFNIKQ